VFDGALAELDCTVQLEREGALHRLGDRLPSAGAARASGFERGRLKVATRIDREGRPVYIDRGEIEAGGRLMHSPAGLGGTQACFGIMIATAESSIRIAELAVTHLPGLVIARYLGDSSEAALQAFTALWKATPPIGLRPRRDRAEDLEYLRWNSRRARRTSSSSSPPGCSPSGEKARGPEAELSRGRGRISAPHCWKPARGRPQRAGADELGYHAPQARGRDRRRGPR